MHGYEKSRALYERACRSLAGGVSSEFRRFNQPHPLFYSSGQGSHVTDVDGNEYLDFTLSQGPLILGHSHPRVLEAVARYSASGQLYAGQYEAELELAERIQRLVPCAELLRFSLSGSEANHAALRVARAWTGRGRFLRFEGHYHGWLDNVAWSISAPDVAALGPRTAPRQIPWTAGLPPHAADESITLPWNDLDLVERTIQRHQHELAAIITEPVMCNSGCIAPAEGFLAGLRELCDRYRIVLILDEVITGFRLGLGGAQKYFDVTPDLAVFGKALASGYPLSVLAGRREFMQLVAEGKVIHAGTMNSGNPSVAAALATLDVLEQEQVHARLFHLGRRLMDRLATATTRSGRKLLIQGYGPMFHTAFAPPEKWRDFRDTFRAEKAPWAAFVRGMQDRGVRLIGRGLWYLSGAHTEQEIDQAGDLAGEIIGGLE